MKKQYDNFDILIGRTGRRYQVRIVHSPAGEASAEFELPFDEMELQNFLLRLAPARQKMRNAHSLEADVAHEFGGRLFDAVFKGQVLECLFRSLDNTRRQEKGLRLRLRLTDTPELMGLPWEYLCDRSHNEVFALSTHTPLIRYLDMDRSLSPLSVTAPLRILLMVSNGQGELKLDGKTEEVRLREALAELQQANLVEIVTLPHATLEALHEELDRQPYHVFHFIGHGDFHQEGYLVLENRDGTPCLIRGKKLGVVLHNYPSLRLAILNACLGAQTSSQNVFAGAAQSLIQVGLPAVIGMQFEITDTGAVKFASKFYRALANGDPVDVATTQARIALYTEEGSEWGTPVIYLRSEDGHLFEFQAPPRAIAPLKIVILYKRHVQEDEYVLKLLAQRFSELGHEVFSDDGSLKGKRLQDIEAKIGAADIVIPLLSSSGISSEMIALELALAQEARQDQNDRPALLPVRLLFEGEFPDPIADILDPIESKIWHGPQDDQRFLAELEYALHHPTPSSPPRLPRPGLAQISQEAPMDMEPVGGPVPLGSRFYVERTTDEHFLKGVARRESIILIKGPRQIGKTSLLARGFHQARASGAQIVLTDFQKLNRADFQSLDSLYMALMKLLSRQLMISMPPSSIWNPNSTPNVNFEDFLLEHVFAKTTGPIVWGLDEVDRLFDCDFGTDVFGLFRSWYNERHLDPGGPWGRLSQVISYATEAYLFISDLNQSPFNVGLSIPLQDFTIEQMMDLNARYGAPLHTDQELTRFYELLGGHPYLVRRGLFALKTGGMSLSAFKAQADTDDGPFSDHLHRIVVVISKSPELVEAIRDLLEGKPCPSKESFFRLRSAGVIAGESAANARFRCDLYATYLKRNL